ncbi:MAG: DUF2244 domain-containing protein [Betaproteobacteria bacterium]|nr:DUF2244 domain-containing protein [Betaproteobacteria bacterium]MDE2047222.1 DUF2244 domain-containing protein [Betaproteobacteria bacterium]
MSATARHGAAQGAHESLDAAPAARDWQLRRNCSVSPQQMGGFYLSLGAVSLSIAAVFWWHGATLVVPFAGLELLALGVALLMYARHATDRELLRLTPDRLEVEWVCGTRVQQLAFDPRGVRVQHAGTGLVELTGQGRQIEVGRYVRPERRAALARELRAALAS